MNKIMTVTALMTALALGACNTMAGLGEDVQAGGENLEDAANNP